MPAARQDAEERAERRSAQHRRGDAAKILAREPEPTDGGRQHRAGLLVLQVAEDLRDAEDADCDGDEIDAGVELAEAEGEARRAGIEILPDHPEQQAEHDHRQRLQNRAVRQRDRGDEAEHDQREIFRRPELQRRARKRRREEHQH